MQEKEMFSMCGGHPSLSPANEISRGMQTKLVLRLDLNLVAMSRHRIFAIALS